MSSISFENSLGSDVKIYDSFSDKTTGDATGHDKDNNNYFGILTSLVTVPAHTTTSIPLRHKVSTLIVSDATSNAPLARLITLFATQPFSVTQADVEAMTQTVNFIEFIVKNPTDQLTTTFKAIWTKGTGLLHAVNGFFAQHPPYEKCTFATYMMGITYAAEQPESKKKPLDQALYSLSTLVKLLGGTWPAGFPDIVVTKFICDTESDVLSIRVEIDLKKLPAQSDQALQFFGSLFKVQKIQAAVYFNHGLDLGFSGTRLTVGVDTLHVPFGATSSLAINKPTVTIDINPLFKFVVFTVTGSIPFSIFKHSFEADVSMVIDNLEANFGVVIKGDHSSLPAPLAMQGVHFDEFGVGIGVFFEPPGAVLGLSGKYHIGEAGSGHQVALDDSTFTVVCQLVEEVPNPLYVSFYVPQMQLADVLTAFTNSKTSLDVPVHFTDLSFKWSENPMVPVALPDGSLSSMGYGFSAAANIAGFSFYGDVELDLENGLKADIVMSPVVLGRTVRIPDRADAVVSVFQMGGDSTGFSIKVDASGNPVKNNQLRNKAAQRKALENATMKQLVPAGGPVLKLQTFASPFLHLNGFVSLFEVQHAKLEADINKDGIHFEMDFDAVLSSKMSCTLADWHNLATSFDFGLDRRISLPTIHGVSLGSISLQAKVNAHLKLSTSTSDLFLTIGGGFDFEGSHRTFGDFTGDLHIQKVTDVLSAIGNYIEQTASRIFDDLLRDGGVWAGKVKKGVIKASNEVAYVLKTAYNKSADETASIMKQVGYTASDVATAMKTTFNQSVDQVASTMKDVGYAGAEVASALKDAFSNEALQVASAMKDVYGWTADQVAASLIQIGFSASESAKALQHAFGLSIDQVADALKDVGYSSDAVINILKGAFGSNASQIASALKSAYGLNADQVASVMKQADYAGNEVACALKDAFGDVSQIASALKDVYGWGPDQIHGMLDNLGFSADQIGSAFQSLGGEFRAVGDSLKKLISGCVMQ